MHGDDLPSRLLPAAEVIQLRNRGSRQNLESWQRRKTAPAPPVPKPARPPRHPRPRRPAPPKPR